MSTVRILQNDFQLSRLQVSVLVFKRFAIYCKNRSPSLSCVCSGSPILAASTPANRSLYTRKQIPVSSCDRRVRVLYYICIWRRQERYGECNIMENDRYGWGSVMVWKGVSINGRTDIHVLDRGTMTAQYREEVLGPIVRPYAGAVCEAFISHAR